MKTAGTTCPPFSFGYITPLKITGTADICFSYALGKTTQSCGLSIGAKTTSARLPTGTVPIVVPWVPLSVMTPVVLPRLMTSWHHIIGFGEGEGLYIVTLMAVDPGFTAIAYGGL